MVTVSAAPSARDSPGDKSTAAASSSSAARFTSLMKRHPVWFIARSILSRRARHRPAFSLFPSYHLRGGLSIAEGGFFPRLTGTWEWSYNKVKTPVRTPIK